MKYCPLMSYGKQYTSEVPCFEEECGLAADGAGNCLIKQFLELYVARERTRLADEEERIRKETEMMKTYFAIKKDGTRTPIQFAHTPEDYPYPHGGVYEDLSDLRGEVELTPRIDGSYITF